MATKTWAISLMFICTILTSVAQVLYKFGSEKLSFDLLSIITNYHIIIGIILYGIGGVIMIIALKGGEVSTLYPIIATSYIWVSLLSPYFFETDSMNWNKWIGVFIIFFGVILVSQGSRRNDSMTYIEGV